MGEACFILEPEDPRWERTCDCASVLGACGLTLVALGTGSIAVFVPIGGDPDGSPAVTP